MLVITNKKYEVEETIKAVDEEGQPVYEFIMALTGEELQRVNEILLDKDLIDMGKKQAKLDVLSDEYNQLEQEMTDKALKNQEEFENIVFKEHKAPFKEKVGDYKYLEMVEMVFNFFWKAFIDKKTSQVSSMTTDLRKLGNS
jgi:hypothetical protein